MSWVWYHGTSATTWKTIQDEGMLWGVTMEMMRSTHLTRDYEQAAMFGDIVLAVDYEPILGQDNYDPRATEIRVYAAIPLWHVTLVVPDEVSRVRELPREP